MFKDIALQITASDPKNVEELLSQPFIKNPSMSVGVLISEFATKTDDRLGMIRFVREEADEREVPKETPPPQGQNIPTKFSLLETSYFLFYK